MEHNPIETKIQIQRQEIEKNILNFKRIMQRIKELNLENEPLHKMMTECKILLIICPLFSLVIYSMITRLSCKVIIICLTLSFVILFCLYNKEYKKYRNNKKKLNKEIIKLLAIQKKITKGNTILKELEKEKQDVNKEILPKYKTFLKRQKLQMLKQKLLQTKNKE